MPRPSEARNSEHFHQQAVVVSLTPVHPLAERIDRVGEIPDSIMGQISFGRLADLGEVQPVRGVGWKSAILHSHLETAG